MRCGCRTFRVPFQDDGEWRCGSARVAEWRMGEGKGVERREEWRMKDG